MQHISPKRRPRSTNYSSQQPSPENKDQIASAPSNLPNNIQASSSLDFNALNYPLDSAQIRNLQLVEAEVNQTKNESTRRENHQEIQQAIEDMDNLQADLAAGNMFNIKQLIIKWHRINAHQLVDLLLTYAISAQDSKLQECIAEEVEREKKRLENSSVSINSSSNITTPSKLTNTQSPVSIQQNTSSSSSSYTRSELSSTPIQSSAEVKFDITFLLNELRQPVKKGKTRQEHVEPLRSKFENWQKTVEELEKYAPLRKTLYKKNLHNRDITFEEKLINLIQQVASQIIASHSNEAIVRLFSIISRIFPTLYCLNTENKSSTTKITQLWSTLNIWPLLLLTPPSKNSRQKITVAMSRFIYWLPPHCQPIFWGENANANIAYIWRILVQPSLIMVDNLTIQTILKIINLIADNMLKEHYQAFWSIPNVIENFNNLLVHLVNSKHIIMGCLSDIMYRLALILNKLCLYQMDEVYSQFLIPERIKNLNILMTRWLKGNLFINKSNLDMNMSRFDQALIVLKIWKKIDDQNYANYGKALIKWTNGLLSMKAPFHSKLLLQILDELTDLFNIDEVSSSDIGVLIWNLAKSFNLKLDRENKDFGPSLKKVLTFLRALHSKNPCSDNEETIKTISNYLENNSDKSASKDILVSSHIQSNSSSSSAMIDLFNTNIEKTNQTSTVLMLKDEKKEQCYFPSANFSLSSASTQHSPEDKCIINSTFLEALKKHWADKDIVSKIGNWSSSSNANHRDFLFQILNELIHSSTINEVKSSTAKEEIIWKLASNFSTALNMSCDNFDFQQIQKVLDFLNELLFINGKPCKDKEIIIRTIVDCMINTAKAISLSESFEMKDGMQPHNTQSSSSSSSSSITRRLSANNQSTVLLTDHNDSKRSTPPASTSSSFSLTQNSSNSRAGSANSISTSARRATFGMLSYSQIVKDSEVRSSIQTTLNDMSLT